MITPLHQRLRDATRPAHDAVDAVFDGFDLTERSGYVAFLRAHAAALSAMPPAPSGLPDLRLATLALSDLARLGAAPPPPAAPLPLTGTSERVGAYYTVAGSRLGGRILAARWRAGADPDTLSAGRYLSDREADAGFRAVRDLLEAEADRLSVDGLVAGALAAFEVFRLAGEAERTGGAA